MNHKELLAALRNLVGVTRPKAVCTVSGGLDSAVAAAVLKELGFDLVFIFFDWGQKTYKKELFCAKKLTEHFGASLKKIEVPILKVIPDITLTEKETLTTKINEYVPNRNSVLETQAVAYAESVRAGVVCVGSTGGDRICPDNNTEFLERMQSLINQGTMLKPSIRLVAPLACTDKTGAVEIGLELGVPFQYTWSCHNFTDRACGKCSNCEERIKAFKVNKTTDPIQYEKT